MIEQFQLTNPIRSCLPSVFLPVGHREIPSAAVGCLSQVHWVPHGWLKKYQYVSMIRMRCKLMCSDSNGIIYWEPLPFEKTNQSTWFFSVKTQDFFVLGAYESWSPQTGLARWYGWMLLPQPLHLVFHPSAILVVLRLGGTISGGQWNLSPSRLSRGTVDWTSQCAMTFHDWSFMYSRCHTYITLHDGWTDGWMTIDAV